MSLFKEQIVWECPPNYEEEYDSKGICMFKDAQQNLLIATGSFQGILRIYSPRMTKYTAENLLYE